MSEAGSKATSEKEGKRVVVGRKLRQAREEQGLSLKTIEQDIKVHAHHLEALERGDMEALPDPSWARGFLAMYANRLGLEEERFPDELFPLRRPSRPRRYLDRRWRGIVAALGALGVVAVLIVSTIVAPYNVVTGWVGAVLHDFAPRVFLGNEPQRIVVLGFVGTANVDGDAIGGDNMFVAKIAEDGLELLSIPRDTPVEIPGYGRNEIGDAYTLGGPDLTRKSVARLTGEPIPSYCVIGAEEVGEIVDAMGGVWVDVARPTSGQAAPGGPSLSLRPGRQTLNGEQALVYLQGTDLPNNRSRATRQQEFLYAMFGQALGPSNLLEDPDTINAVIANTETNLNALEVVQLAGRIRALRDASSVSQNTVAGQDGA